jgi:hypothetical protein
MKKTFLLFLALLLPMLFYVFLKFFGKNNFDLPVYYANGIERQVAGCSPNSNVPYLLPELALRTFGWNEDKVAVLVLDSAAVDRNLQRVQDEFTPNEYARLNIDSATYEIKSCMLLAGDTASVVMVDNQKRIRGYYHPVTRKETDRLILELKVILGKY